MAQDVGSDAFVQSRSECGFLNDPLKRSIQHMVTAEQTSSGITQMLTGGKKPLPFP
jgi:hypothetical protein